MEEKIITEKALRKKTIFSFLFFVLFITACIGGWYWLHSVPKDNGAVKPFRKAQYINENIFSRLYSFNNLTKIYSKEDAAKKVRVNGKIGLKTAFDTSLWRLKIVKAPGDTLQLSLAELKLLPKTEVIFDFKCIEGWSQVSHWGGVRYTDLIKKYNLNTQSQLNYVGLETPDQKYYVGIDKESMIHPQTILSYEMNGKPLLIEHGFPLRLIIPVKYGVKHLKRIGLMYFSDSRPRDYWFQQGYDYYCGL